jgi:hypothetical protein
MRPRRRRRAARAAAPRDAEARECAPSACSGGRAALARDSPFGSGTLACGTARATAEALATRSTTRSAMRRCVVSLPPAIDTRPLRVLHDLVLAGDLRRALAFLVEQRPEAGPRCDHVVARERRAR